MTDIVKRLRDVTGFIQKEYGRVAASACLASEAADEIERLRRRVQRYREAWENEKRRFTEAMAVMEGNLDD